MAIKPVYLTSEGKQKLEEELDQLRTVGRSEVAEAIRSAKEEGDLKENSAYDEAKQAQGFLEGRIQTLEAQLLNAVIIEKNGDGGVVSFLSEVTVLEDGEDEKETYKIVGAAEASPLDGLISNESPIGEALLGKKKGDKVTVETPGGELTLKIVKVA
ncbi:MAG: transcription elongation factor GreA [Chloroflexota bacterium]